MDQQGNWPEGSMIVVAYTYAPNPADLGVAADGTVDASRARPAICEDDHTALELGRQVARAASEGLVGLCVGGQVASTPLARKSAASRGPDELLIVADDQTLTWDAQATASALAALVGRVADARLLITAGASVDEATGVVPALVAARLGWLCLADVTALAPTPEGWQVTQETAEGVRTVDVPGPLVAACTSRAVVAPVPGMRALLAAASTPVTVVGTAELPRPPERPIVSNRHRTLDLPRRQRRFDGPDAPATLLAALRADGVIE